MNRRQLLPTPLLLLTLPLLPAAGCRREEEESAVKVGLSLADGTDPYRQAVRKAAEAFAREKKFALVVQDAQGQAEEQARGLSRLVREGASLVILDPVDAAKLKQPLAEAAAAKVYLVALGGPLPGAEAAAAVVEPNLELAGQFAADYLRHRLPAGGKVGVVKSGPAAARVFPPFRAYLQQRLPAADIVAEESAASEAEARAAVDRLLKANPDLDAVYATSEPAGLAAVAALRARGGSAGAPFVMAHGGTPRAIEEMKKAGSPLALVVVAPPWPLGTAAARIGWRIASNESAPSHLEQAVVPYTRDNAGEFPGWEGPSGRKQRVPWTSELQLKARRE